MGNHMPFSAQCFRVRNRQLCPKSNQKDVVWRRAVSPAYGDRSAGGEVRPEQLLPERDVLLSNPDLSTPILGQCHKPSTSHWVTGLPLLSLPPPFLPGLWPEKSDLIIVGLDHGGDGENEAQGEGFC